MPIEDRGCVCLGRRGGRERKFEEVRGKKNGGGGEGIENVQIQPRKTLSGQICGEGYHDCQWGETFFFYHT